MATVTVRAVRTNPRQLDATQLNRALCSLQKLEGFLIDQSIIRFYEVDPLICEKCGHEMKVIAVITNSHEVRKILECLKRNNAPPFDKVEIKAS